MSGDVHGTPGGWPGRCFLADPADPADPARNTKLATPACYDAVNFARRPKIPDHYGWGYNDETCPPTAMFSAHNVITAPTMLSIFNNHGPPARPRPHQPRTGMGAPARTEKIGAGVIRVNRRATGAC